MKNWQNTTTTKIRIKQTSSKYVEVDKYLFQTGQILCTFLLLDLMNSKMLYDSEWLKTNYFDFWHG